MPASFLIKLQAEACEFCEISQSTFSYRTSPATAPGERALQSLFFLILGTMSSPILTDSYQMKISLVKSLSRKSDQTLSKRRKS